MQFWFDAVEYAYATGDTNSITAHSREDCDTCNSLASTIRDQYDDGGSFHGVQAHLSNIAAAPVEDVLTVISLQVSESSSQEISADGTIQGTTSETEPTNTTFYAAWIDGGWLAAEVVKDQA